MFTLHQYYLRYLEEQSIPKEWYQMYGRTRRFAGGLFGKTDFARLLKKSHEQTDAGHIDLI